MRIQVKGRNVTVTDELRERVQRRFEKVGKQVSELAVLEVELCEERNPANPNRYVADGGQADLRGTKEQRLQTGRFPHVCVRRHV